MTLAKSTVLRKIEFVFTDADVHDVCHYEYNDIITDSGVEIARTVRREAMPTAPAITALQAANTYVYPAPTIPA